MTVTEVRERPILFSGPMVRAILDGRKTQTRRVVKPQPEWVPYPAHVCEPGEPVGFWAWQRTPRNFHDSVHEDFARHNPFGAVGDRLWVRETWAGLEIGDDVAVSYRADVPEDAHKFDRWRSPIHMPRWASRITLEITDVRVERVQEISEADAIAEGVTAYADAHLSKGHDRTPVEVFAYLWDSLNAKRGYGWDVNPWVWVISFRHGQGEIATDGEME